MKQLQPLFVVFLVFLFASCIKLREDDRPPTIYYSIGIYHPNEDVITTDNGETLLILNTSKINLSKSRPTRVAAYFRIDETVDDKTAKIIVTSIYDISSPIVHINEKNQDSLKRNDVVEFISMSIAQDYLNISFNAWRHNKKHYFFITKNPEDQEDDLIVLRFHHNASGDVGYNKFESILTVPISEFKLIHPEKDSVEISVSLHDKDTGLREERIWYRTKN